MYSRLAATLQANSPAARPRATPWRRRTPTRAPSEFLARPAHHRRSRWPTSTARALVAQRLRPLIRAVEVFGFHLATVDLRQSSDKHEAVVAELLATARIEPDYAALAEDDKPDAAAAPARRRPAAARARCGVLAAGAQASWRSSRRPALRAQRYGAAAIRHYIISHTETVSDLLEVLLLQKEVGLMRGTLDAATATRAT